MTPEKYILCLQYGRKYVEGYYKFLEDDDFIKLQNKIKELELEGWQVTSYNYSQWDKIHKAVLRRKEHLKN